MHSGNKPGASRRTKRMLISIEVDVPVETVRRAWNELVLTRLGDRLDGIVFIATEEIDPQVLLHTTTPTTHTESTR